MFTTLFVFKYIWCCSWFIELAIFSKGGEDEEKSVPSSQPGGGSITMAIDPHYRTYGTPSFFLNIFRVFDYYDFYDYESYDYRSVNATDNKSNLLLILKMIRSAYF